MAEDEMHGFELRAHQLGFHAIAGVDEAGRGPLAGPVVAAAVILPPGYTNGEIRDSKKLTPRKREALYKIIRIDAISVGLGAIEAASIDRINILQATLAAMKAAVLNLYPQPDYILIDGINTIDIPIPQETVIRGDSLSVSVAAASIIAKVSRDQIMDRYHVLYPQYNFLKNKGYGTKEHRKAVKEYGRCKIHRRSFKIT
ncbi:MAG: ribonuclease HII [Thermodesulfobacteriota bacterium]|nr:ribonuclease HII [Thermodesulfobacteriota bacterium]